MCGICGFVGLRDVGLLRRMSETLVHRGPDGSGEFVDGDVGLAHRRLAIIDLSENAKQPMPNEDGSLHLVFNGEIYNYQKLTKELQAAGHTFRSKCDAEVVLHAYEEYGEGCVTRFNGMFAFAIWDSHKKKLFAARDRFGIRPFYYAAPGDKLLFASETKALLLSPEIKREADPAAIDEYLTFRSVSRERTMFSQIKRLPPAHTLTFQNGKVALKQYWELQPCEPEEKSVDEWAEEFFELFSDAVKMRLMSDVPYGAHISGGIDSSSVASLMREHSSHKLQTFTVGFGAELDEIDDARAMVKRLGAESNEILVRADDYKFLPEIIYHLDEPLGDAIVIPIYLLAKLSSEKVKVILTGEGADEIFGAYVHHGAMLKGEELRSQRSKFSREKILANILKVMPVSVLDCFFDYPASLGKRGKAKLVNFIQGLDDRGETYLSAASLFDAAERKEMYAGDFQHHISKGRAPVIREALDGEPLLNKLIGYDMGHWLHDNILFKQDKMCMAHSIEGRYPFLDHRLVELMARTPVGLKRTKNETKVLLRRAMKNKLPQEVTARKKQSFYFPTEKVFKDDFADKVKATLSPESVKRRGYFRPESVSKLLGHVNGPEIIYNKQIFALLVLELWHRIFIDGEKVVWE